MARVPENKVWWMFEWLFRRESHLLGWCLSKPVQSTSIRNRHRGVDTGWCRIQRNVGAQTVLRLRQHSSRGRHDFWLPGGGWARQFAFADLSLVAVATDRSCSPRFQNRGTRTNTSIVVDHAKSRDHGVCCIFDLCACRLIGYLSNGFHQTNEAARSTRLTG